MNVLSGGFYSERDNFMKIVVLGVNGCFVYVVVVVFLVYGYEVVVVICSGWCDGFIGCVEYCVVDVMDCV